MDATIEKLLCEHCRPIFAAALDYDRKQLEAKRARRALQEAIAGKKPGDDDVDDDGEDDEAALAQAMRAAKGKMGKVDEPPPGKLPRGAKLIIRVPQDQLLTCISGDISPNDLARKLGVANVTVIKRVQDLIGVPDDLTQRWRSGIGHMRQGRRAIELLRENGMQPLEPAKKGRPRKSPVPTDEQLQRVLDKETTVAALATKLSASHAMIMTDLERYKARKQGVNISHAKATQRLFVQPIAEKKKRAPVPSDEDMQAYVDRRIKGVDLASKYHISHAHLSRCVDAFKRGVPYTPAKTENRVRAERIPDIELRKVLNGKRTALQLANHYRTGVLLVQQRINEFRAELKAGSQPPPPPEHGTGDTANGKSAMDPASIMARVLADDSPVSE